MLTHPHIFPRLSMGGAVSLLPLYVIIVSTGKNFTVPLSNLGGDIVHKDLMCLFDNIRNLKEATLQIN